MGKDVKALIRDARLPEDTVPICLRADLVAEHERAEWDLEAAQRRPVDSLAGNGVRAIAERIEALEQQMTGSTVEFRLRAMPRPAWRAFVAEYPPRRDGDDVHAADRMLGINSATFFDALIRRSVVEPTLDDDDWRGLLGDDDEERARREAAGEPVADGVLTDRQFDDLANKAWALNRRDVDIPFSVAASRTLSSAPE